MKILLTGAAGFIGYHTACALLERGDEVIGFDNFNAYYDPELKTTRAARLEGRKGFTMLRGDLKSGDDLNRAFDLLGKGSETRVCHLAAQAGVRHSVDHPDEFLTDNIGGFGTILELAKTRSVGGVIYASSSSVYGDAKEFPSREDQNTDRQMSLYGMTKKGNELQASVYHNLFGIHCTGLRFFTVYGPWGRPDMALFLFTDAILHDRPIKVFGEGKQQRDFTFVEDIVSGIVASLDRNYPLEIFNLGCGREEELMDFIAMTEKACGKEARKEMLPMQLGDVPRTSADISKAQRLLDFDPKTNIDEGVPKFVSWYREYYGI